MNISVLANDLRKRAAFALGRGERRYKHLINEPLDTTVIRQSVTDLNTGEQLVEDKELRYFAEQSQDVSHFLGLAEAAAENPPLTDEEKIILSKCIFFFVSEAAKEVAKFRGTDGAYNLAVLGARVCDHVVDCCA